VTTDRTTGRPHEAEYLDTPDAVSRWMSSLAGSKLIGLDTEGASFHRFVDRIYLLQVSTRDRSAVIDPLPIGRPAELGSLLEDPTVEIVFHDADYDLRLLQQDYGWQIRNVFDTRVAAQLMGIRAFGLAALLERFFGLKLDKKHQRADWSMRPLTRDMLDYAALDTMYLPDLRDRLKDALEQAGRWSWAREEFTRLEATRWSPDDEGMAFLKMKGARDLNRHELAILRELVAWRDMVAAEQDRATFRILGNEPLFEIIKSLPADKTALGAIKGMPRGILDSRGPAILAAVERGRAVPEAVARANPSTLDEFARIPELRRWQVDVLAPGFLEALKRHSSSKAPKAPVAEAEDRSPYRTE
jgi:ribonuclease D